MKFKWKEPGHNQRGKFPVKEELSLKEKAESILLSLKFFNKCGTLRLYVDGLRVDFKVVNDKIIEQ